LALFFFFWKTLLVYLFNSRKINLFSNDFAILLEKLQPISKFDKKFGPFILANVYLAKPPLSLFN